MLIVDKAIHNRIRQLDPYFSNPNKGIAKSAGRCNILRLGGAALQNRRMPTDVPYPGTIFVSGDSCEVARAGYMGTGPDAAERIAEETKVPLPHVETILTFVEKDIRTTAENIADEAQDNGARDTLRARLLANEGYQLAEDADPLFVAALLIAESVHDGEKRQDGQSYLSHVLASAALYQMAVETVMQMPEHEMPPSSVPDIHAIYRQMALNVLHDTIEKLSQDANSASEQSFFTVEKPTTLILVMQQLVQILAPGDDETAKIPADIVALSKAKDTLLEEYYSGVVSSWRRALAKLTDKHHNQIINPKVGETQAEKTKIMQTHSEYDALDLELKAYIQNGGDRFSGACATAIRQITREEFATRRRTLIFGSPRMLRRELVTTLRDKNENVVPITRGHAA